MPDTTSKPKLDGEGVAAVAKKRQPRFVTRDRVAVQVDGREDLKTLWTDNICKGGLFINTDDPPPVRSKVMVGLATPDGTIQLEAEVVHVIDAAMAAQCGYPAGVGLQFGSVTAAQRDVLEKYISGVVQRLAPAEAVEAQVTARLQEVVALAQNFLRQLEASELYDALDVPPESDADDIFVRVQQLRRLFTEPLPEMTPVQRTRVDAALKQLDRVSNLLIEPKRRLDYDFRHGHVRAEQRIAAGEPVAELRASWAYTFPDRVQLAARFAGQALQADEKGDRAAAIKAGTTALELDPFNTELRAVLEEWQQSAPPAT